MKAHVSFVRGSERCERAEEWSLFANVGLHYRGSPGWPAFWDGCAAHHMMGLASG